MQELSAQEAAQLLEVPKLHRARVKLSRYTQSMLTHKRRPKRNALLLNIEGVGGRVIDLGGCVASRRSRQAVVEFIRPVGEAASIFLVIAPGAASRPVFA